MRIKVDNGTIYGEDFYVYPKATMYKRKGSESKVMNARCYVMAIANPTKCVYTGIMEKKPYRAFSPDLVQNVEFLPKQSDPKVVKMTFYDGTVTTAAAQEGDEFNAEYGMSMCILKYIWGGSGYNTFFRKWMKVDKKRKDDAKAAKIKAEQDAEKARRKNEKRNARRAKKEAEEREDLIDILASAIKKASGEKDK